MVEYRRRRRGR